MQKTGKWLALTAAALILLGGILFAVAQTPPGRERIARMIASALEGEGTTRVLMGRLGGLIPFHLTLDRLALGDDLGEWMILEDLVLKWSPAALLKGKVRVSEISAVSLDLKRLPRGGEGGGSRPAGGYAFPAPLSRLHLERFAIDRLRLGEALLGKPAVLVVEGRLGPSSSGEGLSAYLALERRDGPEARAVIEAELRNKGPELALDLKLDEASGGLGAAALGIRGPLSLALQGDGPLGAWKGGFRMDAADLGEIRSRIDLKVSEEIRMRASGTLAARGTALGEELRRWLSPEAGFDLDLGLAKDGTLMMGPSSLRTKDLTLEMDGTMDPVSGRTRGRFRLACREIQPLGRLAGVELGGEAGVEGRFSGPVLRPSVVLDADLRRPVVERLAFDALLAHIEIELPEDPGSSSTGFSIRGRGEARGATLRGSPPLPERDLKWELAAEWTEGDVIHIQDLRAAGEHISAGFAGRLDTGGESGEITGDLEIRDLRPFAGFSGLDLAGSTRLRAEITGGWKDLSLSARIRGTYDIPGGLDPSLRGLLDKGLDYACRIEVSGAKGLGLHEAALATTAGSLFGEALLDLEKGDIEGTWRMEIPRLEDLSAFLKQDLKGSLEAKGRVEGPLDGIGLAAEVTGRDVLVEGVPLDGLRVSLESRGVMPGSEGSILVEASLPGGRVRAGTGFTLEGDRLRLSSLSLKGPGSEISGGLDLDLKRLLAEGELKGEARDLSPFSILAGEEIGGSVEAEARLGTGGGSQSVIFTLAARDLKLPYGRAGRAEVRGEIGDLFGAPRGRATLNVSGFRREDLVLDTLVFRAEGDGEGTGFSGGAGGRFREALEINVSGRLGVSPGAGEVRFDVLEARYGGHPLRLARPGTVRVSREGLLSEGLAFDLDAGTVECSGTLGRDRLDLDLKLGDVPLGLARLAGAPDLAGSLSADGRLSGSPARPEGSVGIRIEEMRFLDPLFQDVPPVGIEGRASLGRGRFEGELVLRGLMERPFEAKTALPLMVSFSPLDWSMEPGGEITGSLRGDMDLKRVASIIGLDDQILEGRMEIDLTLGGTGETPVIRGGARMVNGVYENNRSGTVLKDIEAEIAAGAPRLEIVRAVASDGGQGKISAGGWLDVLPSRGFPFRVELSLDHAALLRMDEATATMGGRLLLAGSLEKALLEGRIDLETAEIRIPERLPPDIVELEVIEKGLGQDEKPSARPDPGRKVPLELDLALKSPGRAFVRGRGLDSEWQGELRAGGEVNSPIVTGGLSLVRGSFDFLGKRFGLKKGLLSLDGRTPPSPRLEVLAEASGREMTSYIQISGPAKSPEIKLSSDPPLPSDEILSRLLFGRTVSRVTPVQALQLAHAVKVLAGGGMDLMGRSRRWLGVDQLEVEQAEGGTGVGTISAGKYLRDNVYLKVERSIGAEGSRATVEWEVTPSVTLSTDAGGDSEGGVGARWEWDY